MDLISVQKHIYIYVSCICAARVYLVLLEIYEFVQKERLYILSFLEKTNQRKK